MKQKDFAKKRIMHIYIIIFIIILLILIAATLMLKYSIEGEKNLPFNLNKFDVISTAESKIMQDEEGAWHAQILQKNDVYFQLEKNSKYKKEETIKKIIFENFEIKKENENMYINIYRPEISMEKYNYTDEYKINNYLEFTGGLNTNAETLQINNQGGIIGFSIITNNIGEYIFSENEKLPSDGTLLAKAGAKAEDIKFEISFDLVIETNSENRFKSRITLNLPTGNILEEGVGRLEETELKNVIFKRF